MNLPHEVAGIIIRCLDLSEYTPETFPLDALLFGPGEQGGLELDSIASLEIISNLSDHYGLPFDDLTRDDMMSVNSIAAYIARKKETSA